MMQLYISNRDIVETKSAYNNKRGKKQPLIYRPVTRGTKPGFIRRRKLMLQSRFNLNGKELR